MTERIDHTAEARFLEQNAWQKGGPDGDAFIRTHEQRQDMILSAQVHATLALEEQQRIANLIALVDNAARMVAENTAVASHYAELYERIDPQIREGLGL